jgi:hypothetical protein
MPPTGRALEERVALASIAIGAATDDGTAVCFVPFVLAGAMAQGENRIPENGESRTGIPEKRGVENRDS